MTRTKAEIYDAQSLHARAPDDLGALIEKVVARTIANLEHRTVPVRQRALRREAAGRYIGIDAATLQDWAGERPPKGPPFRRLGGRVIYLIEELDAYLDTLPRNAPRSVSKGVTDVA